MAGTPLLGGLASPAEEQPGLPPLWAEGLSLSFPYCQTAYQGRHAGGGFSGRRGFLTLPEPHRWVSVTSTALRAPVLQGS